jgi:hypothetical protein
MKTPKRKTEDNPDMKVLKTSTCKTLSGKSTLTYQVGTQDDEIHVRITKNTGGGFFSDEWVSLIDIRSVLDEQLEGTPVTSFILQPLFHGKSVNTPAFLLAALANEKLLRPMKGKKRNHEPVEPEEFTVMVKKLTASKPKGTGRKTAGKTTKRVTKKAPRKKATMSTKKTSTAQR